MAADTTAECEKKELKINLGNNWINLFKFKFTSALEAQWDYALYKLAFTLHLVSAYSAHLLYWCSNLI